LDTLEEILGSDRFLVTRRLGAGGMGVVYEALDRARQTKVALKTIRWLSPEALYRFKNEFRALVDLHHPNLVRLGELFCENGQWFFTMELLEGHDFLGYVHRPSVAASAIGPDADTLEMPSPSTQALRFDEARLRAALAQLARGIAALHESGRIHRDIKPSNIRVTPEGRVVLLDFGLVRTVADSGAAQSLADHVVGTPEYMAPEQARGEAAGPEADWYSLGVILYEVLSGERPHRGDATEILRAKQVTPPEGAPELLRHAPADLASLCLGLLRLHPEERPTTAQILSSLGVPAARENRLEMASTFVGRDAELSALRTYYDESRSGRAVAVCVQGESGVGKTALVRRFTESLLATERAVVLAGRCFEREAVPFKAVDGVVDSLVQHLLRLEAVDQAILLSRDVPLLARMFPVLHRVPAVARVSARKDDVDSPLVLRQRAFTAFRELLRNLGERAPLVIVIDDFQWSDRGSAALWEAVLAPPDAPPLLFLATVRTASEGSAEGSPVLFGGLESVRQIRLGGLSPEEASALVGLITRDRWKEAEARAIGEEARGHPLFLQELVRYAEDRSERHASGARLDDALWARVTTLAEPARRTLEVLAVAGVPLAPGVAAAAAGLDPGACASQVALLRSQNLVRGSGAHRDDALEPYHDRVRESVVSHLSESARVLHHRALAVAFEEQGASDPRLLVQHLEAAGEASRAAEQAIRAAGMAMNALAFEMAAELYRTSLRLGSHGDSESRALRLGLADALSLARRGAEAAEAYLAAAEGADVATRFECQRRAGAELVGSGHLQRGFENLRTVLGELGEGFPRTQRRALFSLLGQRALLRLRGLGWKERSPEEVPVRALIRIDTLRAVSTALWPTDPVRGPAFAARVTRLSLRAGEPSRVCEGLSLEAVYAALRGDHERAQRVLAEAMAIAQRPENRSLALRIRSVTGIIELFAGRFLAGAEALRPLHEAEWHSVPPFEQTLRQQMRGLGLYRAGQYREACREQEEGLRDAVHRGDRWHAATLARGLAIAWLIRDEPEEALRAIERHPWEAASGEYYYQLAYDLQAQCEIALYQGSDGRLRDRFRRDFHSLMRTFIMRWELGRLHVHESYARVALSDAAAAADPRPALVEAERVAKRLFRSGRHYARAWAGLLRGGIAVLRGDRESAADALRMAAAIAEVEGLPGTAAAARRRLGEVLGGSEGDALRQAADAWFAESGVKNLPRFLGVIAPGFRAV
jgi:hypothetical protein